MNLNWIFVSAKNQFSFYFIFFGGGRQNDICLLLVIDFDSKKMMSDFAVTS